MSVSTWLIVMVATVSGIGLIVAMIFGIVSIAQLLSGGVGGWRLLCRLFPARAIPVGLTMTRQTLKVGHVVYKNCVFAVVAPEGLYLDAGNFGRVFGCGPVIVPWEYFRSERPTTMHWQSAMSLDIGEPPNVSIVVKQPLYEQMRPFLRSRIIDAEPIPSWEQAYAAGI